MEHIRVGHPETSLCRSRVMITTVIFCAWDIHWNFQSVGRSGVWKQPSATGTGTVGMARRPEEQLQSTGRRLQEAQQLVAETEEIASRARNNLGEQREALQRTNDNVEDAQEDAQDAKLHLVSLRSKKQWQLFSLYFIIVVLAAHLVFRIIKSVT